MSFISLTFLIGLISLFHKCIISVSHIAQSCFTTIGYGYGADNFCTQFFNEILDSLVCFITSRSVFLIYIADFFT